MKRLIGFLVLLALPALVSGQALDRRHMNIVNALSYGTSCNATTLNAAISDIGSSAETTLLIPRTDASRSNCTWTLGANVTVTDNISLMIGAGAILSPSGGFTLTLPCDRVQAGDYQIFAGAGTVACSSGHVGTIKARWRGATGDGSTDDSTTLQAALALAAGGTLWIGDGNYSLATDFLTASSNTTIQFASHAAVLENDRSSAIEAMIALTNITNVRIVGGKLDGQKGSYATSRVQGISCNGCSKVWIEDMEIVDMAGQDATGITQGDGIMIDEGTGNADDVHILHNRITGVVRTGIAIIAGTNLWVDGNYIDNVTGSATGACIDMEGDASSSQIRNVWITRNLANDCHEGILLNNGQQSRLMRDIYVSENEITNLRDTVGFGVRVLEVGVHTAGGARTDSAKITNNIFDDNAGYGIYIDGGSANILVAGNTISRSGLYGILITGSRRVTVVDNDIYLNTNAGMFIDDMSSGDLQILIRGNRICNNGQNSDNTLPGILFQGDASNPDFTTVVEGNYFCNHTDFSAVNQTYGVQVNANANNVEIRNNHFEVGGGVAGILNNGSATVRDNVGWVTENSGTGSVTSGSTSDVITHGLSVTPTVDCIQIIGGEDPTNPVGTIWVDTFTATQFTVNVEADPGGSNWDFGWRAVCN